MNQVIKTAIAIVGTQKELLAKACGVSRVAAVQKWLYGEKFRHKNVFLW